MKPRITALTLLAVCLLSAPAALAQRGVGDADSGTIGYIPHGLGADIVSRAFTNAVLRTGAGEVVGKVKTATVVTTTKVLQALRVQVTGLTPNAEYALVIDSTLVGTATATSDGALKMKFADPSNGRVAALPEAVKPIALAQQVQIYEVSSQRLIASGPFGTNGGGAGGR
ncbi:MAG: hypothetical protein IPF53_20910 [Blastocatellia bacterium]|nr:hypothetical protein [Blastocatellia bacterium]